MLLNQMCLKVFFCRFCIKEYLGFCFLYNTAEIAKGTITFVFLVFLSVLFCCALFYAWLTAISIVFKTIIILIIIQIKYPKVDRKAHEINCCCVLLLQIALYA